MSFQVISKIFYASLNYQINLIVNVKHLITMKLRIYSFIFVSVLLTGCGPELKINGKSDYQIVVPLQADSVEMKAAKQLQYYLSEMSGVVLPIVEESSFEGSNAVFIGKTDYAKSLNIDFDRLKEDGYAYKSEGNKFAVAGGSDKGVLYGIYDLLESFGVRKYTSEYTYIPEKSAITLPEGIEYVPKVVFRTTSYSDTRNPEYADWHKLSSRNEWGLFVHTFDRLVPPAEFFKTHPEYYALRDGKRLPTQLCLSNPEVVDVLIKNLKKEIEQKPGLKYWSVSQSDNDKACTCDACVKLNETYGGDKNRHSGAMIYFVNKVAKAFPDKMISTLAYWYTRKAPDNIKPEPNVNIMLCNIESQRHNPVFITDTAFSNDLENWGKLANDILIWDYNIQFSNMVSPFPNLHTIKPNLDFFTKNHVNAFFMQANSQVGGEMAELKAYLISKLLWNPDADDNEIIDDFLNGYYGDAGAYIRQYVEALNKSLQESGHRLGIFGSPEEARETYLSAEMMKVYNQLFDNAEKAVEKDAELLKRVRIARLPIMYAQIQISHTEVDTPRSMFKHDESGKVIISPEIKTIITQFVERAKEQGVNRLRERSISPDEYMESHNRIFKNVEETRDAISFNKKVTAITEPNRRNKQIEALTDGIFGSYESWRDVRFDNWVAYTSRHMDFILDLGEVTPIRSVNMDFFDAKDTWYQMALPVYVTYETSVDGKNYNKAIKVLNPTDPNEPEKDSMPRVIYVQSFQANMENRNARYIKVHAESILHCPLWHVRAGDPAVMYCDEIVVK